MKVTVGNKHERENRVNKNPDLIAAMKSLHRFDSIIEAFSFSQIFNISPKEAEVTKRKDGKGHEKPSAGSLDWALQSLAAENFRDDKIQLAWWLLALPLVLDQHQWLSLGQHTPKPTCAHAHTHTHTHTHTHAMHTHMSVHALTCNAHICTHMYTHTHAHTYTHMHTHTHTSTHTCNARSHIHTYAHTCACSHQQY
jgi:phosphoenolpyruvate carboxylase